MIRPPGFDSETGLRSGLAGMVVIRLCDMRRLLGPALALAIAATAQTPVPASAQRPAPAGDRVEIDALGPQPGAPAPAIRLPDHLGAERTLASLAGPRGTMLVFFRSADW
jgi:hypothetical protein